MYYFIVNPAACGGQGERIWRKLERRVQRAGIPYRAYLTEGRGDAARYAAEITGCCKEPCTVVAVGGDGTANEVLNGLSVCDSVTCGLIPTGSGNDLARGLKLPCRPGGCLKRILKPRRILNIDYGILSYEMGQPVHRRFVVSSGIGLDAAICHSLLDTAVGRSALSRRIGWLRYASAGFKQLFKAEPVSGYVLLDGVKRVEFNHIYFISAHIHPWEGGGFQFAPKANPESGELELCVVHVSSRWKLFPVLLDAWAGRMGHHRGVRFYRCREVQIHVDSPVPVHADGESCCCQTDIHLRCVEKKLRVIV
ncbi:MAG: diacylglycerol kinase family lipid kinase [Eubacteriales bacterium]|nr:diacylglycerol kinase family lipid kinase [Eubacteriales bacterium]